MAAHLPAAPPCADVLRRSAVAERDEAQAWQELHRDGISPFLTAQLSDPSSPLPIRTHRAAMAPTTRDLLAEVLGERQLTETLSAPPPSRPAASSADAAPGPWRVTAQVHGGRVQISNNRESRVVRKAEVEVYLRGHGPAVAPRC